jgi:hypothetical protein
MAGGVGIILIAMFAYWLLKPKTLGEVASRQRTEQIIAPRPSVEPSTLPSETHLVAQENTSDPQTSQADAVHRERERLAAEVAKSQQARQQEREQEQSRQQEFARRQQEAEAQQRAFAELKAKQEEQQRQIDEERRKLAEDQAQREREALARRVVTVPIPAPAPTSPLPPTYRGPSSGELVWEGPIKGTELITIENGQASSGTVTGALPGVAVLLQPTDTKKVSIASTPGPRNQYIRVVFRVTGNGNTKVTLKWSLP